MSTAYLSLLRRHRAALARVAELELADLDRQIAACAQGRPRTPTQTIGIEHERALLRVLQAATEPLPVREVAQRLNTTTKNAANWIAASLRRGFVVRVRRGRYRAAEEVPPMT